MISMAMNELKNFDIYVEYENAKEITITDLLNEEKCLAFLQKQMIDIKAPNLAVAASMLSKRYAYLVVSSTLYSMVEFNCALNLPVKACALSKERTLCIQEGLCKWQELKGMEREQWRISLLQDLFSDHITPVLNILNKISRAPSSILWENVAIRINSIYRKTLAKELDPVKIKRLTSDFNFLKNASGKLFNLKSNPLKPFLKIGEEHTCNPYRRTCCMYNKLEKSEGISYCGNCPVKLKQTKARN
ncbi:IucA/IucC family C-terminal-domain containing protein [Paenisporosarcina antarctica]|uniref:Fe-S oxidoreductase n=1 Tax=Paenisporosarcina antarctica TaxID=417367 RepID=A0A4P6ZUF5_9BACL|nr:IucA/IucC family C-terminal-domain containing protein [Paenisporosarcina antarctica]QBP39853.1 Fe-S oxidoreductase [Paenisporosarcina antarctica]